MSLLAILAAWGFLVNPVGRAQEGLDPNSVWYRGFLLVQSARDLEAKGQYLAALNKLNEAKPIFDHLSQQFPDFQPEIVRQRRALIAEKRDELKVLQAGRPALAAPASPQPAAPPSLPNASAPVQAMSIAPPPIPSVDEFATDSPGAAPGSTMVIADGEFALPSWDQGTSQALPGTLREPVPGMPRVQAGGEPSTGSVANSLYQDLSSKDALISWLNDENQKLRKEVTNRERLLREVNSELARTQSSRDELMRRVAAAEADGGVQAQEKVEQLKELLRDATTQLEEATKRNAQLVAAMQQSEQEMSKLRVRMAELERERDNLAEVVRGDGTGGKALKELMDRNRTLTEQLDRAEQLAESLSDLNKEKDDDIALLKNEITRIKVERDQLLAENARHQQSIDDLRDKLEMLSDGLTPEDKQALASATPVERHENELLRSLVLKQLRRQAQMKQAKELLLKQLDQVGARSDTLLGVIEDMARGSQLTEEEKALFKAPQFEAIIAAANDSASGDRGEATSGEAGSGEGAPVMTATLVAAGNAPVSSPDGFVEKQKLSVELAQIDKAARLDFQEGRYSEAEAGFLEYLRYLPRNVPCLCNLGILKTAMKNYSEAEYYLEKALAIDAKSGLASYLLGRAYFLQDKLDEALAKFETGLNFDPQNAKAHNCVGIISTRKGWVARAERAFVNAVSIDPEFGDAHFNLAVLHATKEEPNATETGKHYFRALDLGVPRDATIEDFLKEAEAAGVAVGMR